MGSRRRWFNYLARQLFWELQPLNIPLLETHCVKQGCCQAHTKSREHPLTCRQTFTFHSRSHLWLRLCVSVGVTEASLHLPEALLDTPASAALTGGCWGHHMGSPLSRNDSPAPSLQWELWPKGCLKTGECLTPTCVLEQGKKSNLKTFCFFKLGWFCTSMSIFQLWLWAELTRKAVRGERVVASTTHRLQPSTAEICATTNTQPGMKACIPETPASQIKGCAITSQYFLVPIYTSGETPPPYWIQSRVSHISPVFTDHLEMELSAGFVLFKSLPTACHLSSAPHAWLYKDWLARRQVTLQWQ